MAYYVGLMSGTSADGIDAALLSIEEEPTTNPRTKLIASHSHPLPSALRKRILELGQAGSAMDDIDHLGRTDTLLGKLFADAALALLDQTNLKQEDVSAIGSHGQTVRHRPARGEDQPAFTLQIGDPNIIAERTGITTVADFRRRDMAAGGQGAPLAPAFHAAAFGSVGQQRIILNLGGIANISVLDGKALIAGYDTGPANGLMDAWISECLGQHYDENGQWAAGGQPNTELLATLLAHPYFSEPAPKSTGREMFSLAWLKAQLKTCQAIDPQDVQATLLQLTVRSLQNTFSESSLQGFRSVFLCGGGVHNKALLAELAKALPGHKLATTVDLGIDPDWVEACAFAWLAAQTLGQLPGNAPIVTGANGPRILGAIYPGLGQH